MEVKGKSSGVLLPKASSKKFSSGQRGTVVSTNNLSTMIREVVKEALQQQMQQILPPPQKRWHLLMCHKRQRENWIGGPDPLLLKRCQR